MDDVSQLLYVWYYVGVKSSFQHRNASPREPMCFKCLMFSLSGHCELLFYFVLFTVTRKYQYVCIIMSSI